MTDEVHSFNCSRGDEFEGYQVWTTIREWGWRRDPAALPALVRLLEAPEAYFPEREAIRRICAWALAQYGLDAIMAEIPDPARASALLREGYADALGETHDSRAIPMLADLALDPERSVASWASLGLSKCGDESIAYIRPLLNEAVRFDHAANLVDALLKLGTPDADALVDDFIVGSAWHSELLAYLAARANQP